MRLSEVSQIETKGFPVQPIRSNRVDELVTPCYEVWHKDQASFAVLIKKNIRLMYALNSLTNHFPEDTKFQPDDEPVFKVSRTRREALVKVLEVKYWPGGL